MFRTCAYLLVVVVAVCYGDSKQLTEYARIRRQVFGGHNAIPGGGFSSSLGYGGSIYRHGNHDITGRGYLSQNTDPIGHHGPLVMGGDATWTAPRSSLTFSGMHAHRGNTQLGLSGSLDVVKVPDHKVSVFGSHTKVFDPSFREIGKGSSTAGVGYEHRSGGGLSLSGTHTPGVPNSGSISGNVPLYRSNDGSARLDLNGQVNMMEGHKPQSQIGVTFEKKF